MGRSSLQIALFFLAFATARPAHATDVNLAWDPADDSSIVSYRVYFGTASRVYGNSADTGFQTGYTIRDLGPGTYYFAVTAVNASGLESDFSNEVSTTISAPSLSILSVHEPSWIAPTAVVISWTTSRAADSLVEYGSTSLLYGYTAPLDPRPVMTHSVLLSGLSPGSTYHFRVRSSDNSGSVFSDDLILLTPVAGSIASYTSSYAAPAETGTAGREGQYSGISIVNLEDSETTVLLWARDANGIAIRGISNPAIMVLKPREQVSTLFSQVFGPGLTNLGIPAWISLESNARRLAGMSAVFNSSLTMLDAINAPAPALTSFVLGDTEPDGFTRIDLANPGPEPASVTLELVQPDGNLRAVETRSIAARAGAHWDLYLDLFAGAPRAAGDYVRGRSDRGIVVEQASGRPAAWITELPGEGTCAATLYAPHYVQDGTYLTTVSIMNQSAVPGYVSLRLIGNDGAQIGNTRLEPVPAGGKIRIDDPGYFGAGAAVQGSLEIRSAGLALVGEITFSDPARDVFAASVPLIPVLRSSALFAQVASDETYFTGLTMLNAGGMPARAQVEVFDPSGKSIAGREILVPPGGRVIGLLTELFPSLSGRPVHSGYMTVKSDQPLASYVLFGTHDRSCLASVPGQDMP